MGAKKMSPVVHFEMPAKDKKRVSKFYENAFGWGMNLVDEMGDYVIATTSETGEDGFPKKPGRINGGFFNYDAVKPGFQYPSLVIAVDDIYQAMKDVEAAGGKVFGGKEPGKPDDIPGIGLYVAIEDTEGNRVGMLQPSQM